MRFLRRKAMMIAAHLSYLSDRRLYAFNMLLQLTYWLRSLFANK